MSNKLTANKNFFKNLSIKDKILLIACTALLGVIILNISGSLFPVKAKETQENTLSLNAEVYRNKLETQLEETLGKVNGMGEIEVMITLKSEIKETVFFNETSSENSISSSNDRTTEEVSSSKDAVMIKNSDGSYPYTVANTYPEVVGVIIVAQGANNAQIKAYIIEAVKAALGVGAHKIVVLPKGSN